MGEQSGAGGSTLCPPALLSQQGDAEWEDPSTQLIYTERQNELLQGWDMLRHPLTWAQLRFLLVK